MPESETNKTATAAIRPVQNQSPPACLRTSPMHCIGWLVRLGNLNGQDPFRVKDTVTSIRGSIVVVLPESSNARATSHVARVPCPPVGLTQIFGHDIWRIDERS